MLQLKHIRKAYRTDDFTQVALDDVSVAFRDSEFVAILGPSGSGKTTMLNILGGLDRADSGEIVINGVSTRDYSSKDWDTYRNHRVGFVFQSYNLIPHQSVLSNVELALALAGVGRAERRRRATEALAAVGLADHVRKRPAQLSGGQMQRVAIARALVNDPDIVLADEPTGALDTDTGIQVMNILRDVARDRLVVMVTHNPELAERYATRIVRVRDGRIVDDSDPIRADEPVAASLSPAGDAAQAPLPAGRTGEKDKGGRASMGFLTALSLSFNNLMTKKGRTFMTAFAGSIGIIGIAAILALSNGVNHYIARTEEGALSSYPLTITKSSFDFSKLMGYGMGDSGLGGTTGARSGAKRAKGSDDIPQRAIVTDMFAQVKSNDLGSFKTYLDAHRKKVGRYANAVEYDYDVTPQIYMADTSKGVTRLNPSSVAATLQGGVMGSALTGGSSSSGTFAQLVSDERLLRSNMSLVRGTWPKAADEAVLVLNRKGEVSDYTLYGIGFYDLQSMQKMTDAALGGQKVEVSRKDRRDFTYDDALGMTFSVVPSANLYQRNDAQGTWTDMSGDEAYMRQQVRDGIKLKIVGVIRPKGDAQSGLVKEGVAYTPALTQELMRRAASSQIVREQQARRDVDVFTGKTFEELRQSQESFDMRKMFTVDQDALKRAFTIDTSAVSAAAGGLDSSALDLSGISLDQAGFDPSAMTLDTSALDNVLSADTVQGILRGVEPFSAYAEKNGLTLTEDQSQAVDKASAALVTGYLAWRQGVGEGADSSWDAYSQTPEAQAVLSQLKADLGDDAFASVSALYQQYMGYVGDYVRGQVDALVQQAAQVMATQLASQMSAQVSAATQSLGTQLSAAVSQQVAGRMAALSGALQNGFSVDPEAFANAIHLNMTADDLRSLLDNYASADKLTYDSNMRKLGFADASSPESVSIYPKDFAAKESLLKVIDEYNRSKAAKGQDGQKIQYSDVAGSLMSSVTDIVNMISTVLIAFVSISLVVSSIMIGIITYISVLERKKEIGVLRAMGASKLNVANVFNAETVIEGLIAGVLAIAVVLVAQVPVNHAVLAWKGIPDIMMLPWESALALIGVSVLLTFLGGLIPSTKASRNDPVESLRSE